MMPNSTEELHRSGSGVTHQSVPASIPSISVRETTSLAVKPMYKAAVVLLPFQFPSVEHFVVAADDVITRDVMAKGLSQRTLKWWRECLHAFTRFLFETKSDLRFLSGDLQRQVTVLEDWVIWLRDSRRVKHVTVRSYWIAMTAICARLERAHALVNPFGLLETPKAGPTQARVLIRAQAERLVAVVAQFQWGSPFLRDRNLAIVCLMLLGGLRRGEVLRLQTGDINIEQKCIRIRKGKGKYGGKPRTAYMAPQLRFVLATYLETRRDAGRADPHLITLGRTDTPATVTMLKRLFERLTSLVGFRVSPHMLRHTYATLLRQAGVSDRISMELMGHQSLTMLKRYSHVFESEFETEAQKLLLDVPL
jgi:integrase